MAHIDLTHLAQGGPVNNNSPFMVGEPHQLYTPPTTAESVEKWRVLFRNELDIPNDEFEEILDWSTRSFRDTNHYLAWLFCEMVSGRTLESLLAELE